MARRGMPLVATPVASATAPPTAPHGNPTVCRGTPHGTQRSTAPRDRVYRGSSVVCRGRFAAGAPPTMLRHVENNENDVHPSGETRLYGLPVCHVYPWSILCTSVTIVGIRMLDRLRGICTSIPEGKTIH